MSKKFSVAIVGASGIVGQELISILQEKKFPISSLTLLASKKSAGTKIEFAGQEIAIQELNEHSFKSIDIAFFAAGGEISKKYCPLAAKAGAICIDKSSFYRLDSKVPLICAEANMKDVAKYKNKNIIACPNCTTTPLTQILKPLQDYAKIKRVVVTSLQAVSGAGKKGLDALETETRSLFNLQPTKDNFFNKQIAFNVIPRVPHDTPVAGDGYSGEELKLINETRKILSLKNLKITATCTRVSVFHGHSEAVNIEFKEEINIDKIREVLAQSSGLIVIDDNEKEVFPTPLDAAGKDETLVGRIRRDQSVKNGICLWLCSDNLRTGAALNAVKIAQNLCEEYLS